MHNLHPSISAYTCYNQNKSLLDYSEIVQDFIKNNNRILDYIHQHSKIVD
ncbi:hypothetical protein SALWKB29_0613 [Snodgrassella communis]|uniref:Uncharacterized protein n=1 Tax=Snodgrassella communis TaxID=2946699 RepID=A0A836MRX2_9NEIS|nr:hypothetical protein SALWKB29_0613 [Snodgrassella communis]